MGKVFVCLTRWRDRAKVIIALSSAAEVSERLVSTLSHHFTMWNPWNLLTACGVLLPFLTLAKRWAANTLKSVAATKVVVYHESSFIILDHLKSHVHVDFRLGHPVPRMISLLDDQPWQTETSNGSVEKNKVLN